MLYVYQPQGLKQSLWEGIRSAAEAVNEEIALWHTGHESKIVADLIRQTLPQREGETPSRFIPEDKSPDATMVFLFMDFPEEKLQEFLTHLRENNCHIPLKAMRTQANTSWTLRDLLEDVVEEAQIMGNLMQLRQLVQASDAFPKENYAPEAWQRFQTVKSEALALLAAVGKRALSSEEVVRKKEQFNQAVLQLFQKEDAS